MPSAAKGYNIWHRETDRSPWYLRHKGLSRRAAANMPPPESGQSQILRDGQFPIGPLSLTDNAFEVVSVPGLSAGAIALVSGSRWVFGRLDQGTLKCSKCEKAQFSCSTGADGATLRCLNCGHEIGVKC